MNNISNHKFILAYHVLEMVAEVSKFTKSQDINTLNCYHLNNPNWTILTINSAFN